MTTVTIGTAGWTVPRDVADRFPPEGTSLERYAARFNGAEINSSFHRPHRASTWERWGDSVPADFRFSVKLPKTITHQARLAGCEALVAEFLDQAVLLGPKLAVLLVQLPPKLELDEAVATEFFRELSGRCDARIACEPRHVSWFSEKANRLLERLHISRVAADPAICEAARRPGGWEKLTYWRLHGSPVIYRSSYADRIAEHAASLSSAANRASECWCIFDNTASSAAAGDALALSDALDALSASPRALIMPQ